MAFKKLQGNSGDALKAEQLKGTTGFLVGIKTIKIKGNKKPSTLYTLEDQKTGANLDVWGNAAINGVLSEDGKGQKMAMAVRGKLIRLTYKGTKKVKGRPQPMKMVDVEVDDDAKRGDKKDYVLKK